MNRPVKPEPIKTYPELENGACEKCKSISAARYIGAVAPHLINGRSHSLTIIAILSYGSVSYLL